MRTFITAWLLFYLVCGVNAQELFRSGMFLHHSTGDYLWGPNPDGTSTTTVPEQIQVYNTLHGYHGDQVVTLEENWWEPPDDNEWSTLHHFFESDTVFANGISPDFDFGYCLEHYKILVVKTCYPSSWMAEWGQPSDTLDPLYKSMYNYKWHWRHMIRAMKQHPDHFFVMWTNAPLVSANTSAEEARLSRSFCKWAADTLARGLDAQSGPFPENVLVFDYFSKVTDAGGFLKNSYAIPADNYHPNGAATDLIAPQFVREIFDAAVGYKNIYAIEPAPEAARIAITPCPNPFLAETTICIRTSGPGTGTLKLFSPEGVALRTVWHGPVKEPVIVRLNGSQLSAGVYILTFTMNGITVNTKLVHI